MFPCVHRCPADTWGIKANIETCVFSRPIASAIIPTSKWGKEWGRWQSLHKLSDVAARSDRLKPGRHSDGGGLYLNVSPSGSKTWLFMWARDGKRREMGLGSYPVVSLATPGQRRASTGLLSLTAATPWRKRTGRPNRHLANAPTCTSSPSSPNGATPSRLPVEPDAHRLLRGDPAEAGFQITTEDVLGVL